MSANALVVPCPGHTRNSKIAYPTLKRWAILFRPAKRDWSFAPTQNAGLLSPDDQVAHIELMSEGS
jgi:hypothetical protein